MAKQTINIGSTANDGTGSTLRVGGDIINDNFNEIYTAFGDGSTLTAPLTAAGTATLTNKTIDLDANTVTGTLAEFNTALQGDSFVSLTGTETLTNKTLTSPKINEDVAVTSTATEINLLDGVTATTAELNFTDGVTSNIQTQLDTKASNAFAIAQAVALG